MKLFKKITSRTIFFFYDLDINVQDPKCKLKTLFLYIKKKEKDMQGRYNKKKWLWFFLIIKVVQCGKTYASKFSFLSHKLGIAIIGHIQTTIYLFQYDKHV
jgi:hypothetical protein